MKLTAGSAPLSPLEILQICLTLLCVTLAFLRPTLWERGWLRIEQRLLTISVRPWLCMLIVGLLPVCVRLVLLPVWPPPTPYVHDEFAYLLQADTFTRGRVTNPSPPLPDHFASVYILVKPTYTAEYQPAQALALSVGQRLTGSAWAGVAITMGMLCALLYWELLAWVPSIWALLGAGIFGIQIGVLTYWMNSYWGGSVAATGGALLFGALGRLRFRPRASYALLAAVGLVIVLNSRPLEGALCSIIAAGALLYWAAITKELTWGAFFRRVVAPAAVIFAIAIPLMTYYNYRVTGVPTKFPYLLYREAYGTPQGFVWQKAVTTSSSMPVDMESVYLLQLRQHERERSIAGLIRGTARKIRRIWEFYVGIPLTVTLLFLPFIWRERNMGLVLWGVFVILCLDNLTFFEYYPHYSAPIAGLLMLVVIQCLRRVRHSGQRGVFLSRSLSAVCVLGLLIPAGGRFVEVGLGVHNPALVKLWHDEFWYPAPRAKFLKQLESEPGRHLVFVRYRPAAVPIPGDTSLELQRQREDTGWIYNFADLRTTKVLWARDLNPQSNRQLVKCFPGRRIWLVEPDERPFRLRPYPDTSSLQ